MAKASADAAPHSLHQQQRCGQPAGAAQASAAVGRPGEHRLGRGRSVTLPVIATEAGESESPGGIRPSRNGKRRAIVLAIVQGLIIAHIVIWLLGRRFDWFGGRTITPVEPSESMEFVRHGVVNAGLIFFSLALLSTLILGRWFCGWGCHVVMLQDLCGWMMRKLGVRPRPFRSRLLIYVPLLLALYMFVWPAAYRWGVLPAQAWLAARWSAVPAPANVAPWGFHSELTTREFWKTFPGAMVAVPFLLVCGFATVYFLGSKGFCTYGCPYGGFFAPLDKLAPGRIRVTDACEGCGHCTAVCTSNVRVHEEVREFGMVVDPGCMKCLDCVSVCPNEALYFGFGRPSMLKGAAKNQAPRRTYDLTLGEELLCAGVFAVTFFSTRGVYTMVPMLMAGGVAGCVTFIAWKLWRMLRDPSVTLHRFQLKLRGKWTRAGAAFAALTIAALVLVLHSGAVNAAHAKAGWIDDRVTVPSSVVFSALQPPADTASEAAIDSAMRERAAEALRWYGISSSMSEGGIGLSSGWQGAIDIRRAWLHCVRQEWDAAEAVLRRAHQRDDDEATAAALAMLLRQRGARDPARAQEAIDLYERTLVERPEYAVMLQDYHAHALAMGRIEPLIDVHRTRLQRDPRNVPSLRGLSLLLLQLGQLDEGLALNNRWIEREPSSAEAHHFRSLALADLGQLGQAIEEMRLARKSEPRHPVHALRLAEMLDAAGLTAEAAQVREELAKVHAGRSH